MQQIVSSVMCIDLLMPIVKIVSERRDHVARCSSVSSKMTKFRSIYRDILFLTFVALGQPNIHVGKFIYMYFSNDLFFALLCFQRLHCRTVGPMGYVGLSGMDYGLKGYWTFGLMDSRANG